MTPLGYIMILFGVTLIIIFTIYLLVSKKTKEYILEILKVFGSVISLLSLFLVTYNNYINGINNKINSIGDFNKEFSNGLKNVINILNNDNLNELKNEIFYNNQENVLSKTVITEKEHLYIIEIIIIMDNLYLKLIQEEKII